MLFYVGMSTTEPGTRPFVLPEAYRGIEEFDKSPEDVKQEIKDHCEGHTRLLEDFSAKLVHEGTDPHSSEILRLTNGIDCMAEVLSLVWESDNDNGDHMWPLYLKYKAIMNEIQALEDELGITDIVTSYSVT